MVDSKVERTGENPVLFFLDVWGQKEHKRCMKFPLPQTLLNLGWYANDLTECWHFALETSSESGIGLDYLPDTSTLLRWEWFMNDYDVEYSPDVVSWDTTADDLERITNEIIPLRYEVFY